MQILPEIGVILLAYLIGAIPFGLLVVKLKTGKDVREVESGRTGGTNAMRAAGFWAGFITAMLDILKGAGAVWLAAWLSPAHWAHVAAPLAAILGHNYSIFLLTRDEKGRVRLGGGAGGAPSVGGAIGLWPGSVLIILPLGMLTFFSVGIASVTTMSVAFFAIIVFSVRALQGSGPWLDVLYGIGAELLLIWALRPNLKKLFAGQERVVKYSLHGWLKARKEKQET
ncbi:MAG: glycerol-3-phosphate acyltransferase [Chloroflexi bacterium]|nr:glycerol-3-phosphate acyltransferase [Chloroflexota bacterium]